jgi:hypothetical protein
MNEKVREFKPENKRERSQQNTKEAKFEKIKGFCLLNENCFTINKKIRRKKLLFKEM